MLTEAASASWACDPAGLFDWRCWDGEMVVYVLANGCTHELDAAASAVLSVLIEQPGRALNEAQLLAALDDEPEEEGGDGAAQLQEVQALRKLLGQMASMGLVEARLLS